MSDPILTDIARQMAEFDRRQTELAAKAYVSAVQAERAAFRNTPGNPSVRALFHDGRTEIRREIRQLKLLVAQGVATDTDRQKILALQLDLRRAWLFDRRGREASKRLRDRDTL